MTGEVLVRRSLRFCLAFAVLAHGAAEYYKGFAYDPEAFTRVRIVALVDYVYSLQSHR